MDKIDIEKRVYEFSYLLVPTMAEEDVAGKVSQLKKIFTDSGAEIIADEAPEYIGLAYTIIHKVDNKNVRVNSAYFGWFKFMGEVDVLEKVKMKLDRDNDLVRHLLIKTVAENTMAPKKLSQKREVRKRFTTTTPTQTVETAEAVDTVVEVMPEDAVIDSPELVEDEVKE
ncbi:hypothetical protein A3J61_00950 [Candidatus Nomurabacteria bacterium RIFCSPHIGHO2_02_FULL_38_15]|uniref:Small ribosomal subunit protein bS6 n=1 Tax=Candidatus Nomurabacteria bacterium RIFCSPHIGHO2_02_FULL_38_15 TaxID=1801752 RepID=A0A1F6VRB3_9BACT|nr:MAG: hypothetical protein A3J61_00950 [Candidatus Nomurabacteria bacterium RIFCSPHIGHO2_02_FULL_38_15]